MECSSKDIEILFRLFITSCIYLKEAKKGKNTNEQTKYRNKQTNKQANKTNKRNVPKRTLGNSGVAMKR